MGNLVEVGLKEPHDQARDAFSLYYIQQALYDNILLETTSIETTKEAWDILKLEFGIKGVTLISGKLSHIM